MHKLIILILFIPVICKAEVQAKNYDFSLDSLSVFESGNSLEEAKSKWGEPRLLEKNESSNIYRFYVAHIRYKFAVIVQERNGKILDFVARLPQYFLHDLFLQSLINRKGKNYIYKKPEATAVYVWNAQNKKMIYTATCTITCFPIMLASFDTDLQKKQQSYQPLYFKMADFKGGDEL